MAQKYKLTGCAKFFIFFIIAAPLAYIGASYYQGQDPFKQVRGVIDSFRDDIKDYSDKNESAANQNNDESSVYTEIELKELEIKSLRNELKDCKKVKNKQQQLIDAQKKEIKDLKDKSNPG